MPADGPRHGSLSRCLKGRVQGILNLNLVRRCTPPSYGTRLISTYEEYFVEYFVEYFSSTQVRGTPYNYLRHAEVSVQTVILGELNLHKFRIELPVDRGSRISTRGPFILNLSGRPRVCATCMGALQTLQRPGVKKWCYWRAVLWKFNQLLSKNAPEGLHKAIRIVIV